MKKYLYTGISLLLIASLFTIVKQVYATTLTTNLVSYWKMDGNSTDALGTNSGTDTNMSYSSGCGKIIQGGCFSGTGYVSIGHSGFPTGNNDFTMSAWVKLTNTSARYEIFTFGTASTNNEVYWAIETGGKQFIGTYGGTGTHEQTSTTALSSGTWYFVTIVYTASTKTFQFYLNASTDGTMVDSNTLNLIYGNNFIGTLDTTNWDFNGDIDEVGFWSRKLTGAEITQLYNSGVGIQYPFTTSSITNTSGQKMLSAMAF